MIKRLNDNDITSLFGKMSKKMPDKEKLLVQKETHLVQIQKNWKDFAGEGLASHSVPLMLKEGELSITADHPMFSQQILLLQKEICKKINEILPVKIKKFRVKTGRLQWLTDSKKSHENGEINENINRSIKRKDIMSQTGNMVQEKYNQQNDQNEMKTVDLLIKTMKEL